MKRALSILLALCLLAGVLSACGTEPAAVFRTDGRFVKGGIVDVFAIEYGEKAHKVAGIVDRRTVKKDQIVSRVSASYVDSGVSFTRSLDAGHELECLQDIVHSEESGKPFQPVKVERQISCHKPGNTFFRL